MHLRQTRLVRMSSHVHTRIAYPCPHIMFLQWRELVFPGALPSRGRRPPPQGGRIAPCADYCEPAASRAHFSADGPTDLTPQRLLFVSASGLFSPAAAMYSFDVKAGPTIAELFKTRMPAEVAKTSPSPAFVSPAPAPRADARTRHRGPDAQTSGRVHAAYIYRYISLYNIYIYIYI